MTLTMGIVNNAFTVWLVAFAIVAATVVATAVWLRVLWGLAMWLFGFDN